MLAEFGSLPFAAEEEAMPHSEKRRLFKRILALMLLAAPVFLSLACPARGATSDEVDKALAKAKKFLYSRMKNGNWEAVQTRDPAGEKYDTRAGQFGGRTAVAVYALLASGEDPAEQPQLKQAVEWLKTADMIGTYALATRCQVWFMLPRTAEYKKLAEADRDKLQGGYDSTPRSRGLFLYNYLTTKRDLDLVDHSVSQFGVLSMWACAQMGIEIPTRYWSDVDKRWTFDQQPDGGWFYSDKGTGTDHPAEQASMTAAGVATLYITQDYVHQADGVKCIGNLKNDHIDKGLQWMADHTADWTPDGNFGGYTVPGYTLYGVERIGVASGLKYFGTVDWYQYGADWCVRNQADDGSWNGWDNIPNTALCVLFLARGRAPVLINKVQYDDANGPNAGKAGPWNQRPRDVANFVRWMSEQTERDINWQVTNLQVPEDELHDAPFLYFSGNKALNLKPDETDKLGQFVRHGGMILFNSDCGLSANQSPFVLSVSKLGRQLFPDYEFRDIPATHPMFTSEQYPPSRWKRKVTLRGLSNGVRELMVIMPNDPAKAWQLQETGGAGREESYQATDDLILYGTDKENLLVKGQSFLIKPDPKITAAKTVKLARLKYDRNWNPEPGGWDRLAAVLHNNARVDLTAEPVVLGDQPITGYPIAHLTGTTTVNFTPDQQQQLKNFVQGGGTLVIDCAGGTTEFAQSAEALLNKLYPEQMSEPLPASDPIYTAGFPKTPIHYRHFAKSAIGNVKTPQIRVVRSGGRNAVYYSRYDLSAGLVGEPVDGIVGYDPDSSSEIMSGIILQSLGK
jgi:hypothetical protein